MKNFIEWLWWTFAATLDEKYDHIHGKYVRAHSEDARKDNYLGHTSECCEPTA